MPVVTTSSPDPPSVNVVLAELNRAEDSLERRGAQVDTKAGLILATAGVVITFGAPPQNLLEVLTKVAAAVAGALAVLAITPRVAGSLSPQLLRDTYVHRPEDTTKLVVLDTRLATHASDEKQLVIKANRLKRAAVALGTAVVLALMASIVGYAQGGTNEQPKPGHSGSDPATSTAVPS